MRLPALIHLVESVRTLSHCERIFVFGSSSLLPSFAQLGEPGGPLELTFDADFLIEPSNERLVAMLHAALGEGSLFARETGYCADFLRPEITEVMPAGWESRVVPVAETRALALAPVDLVVMKLRAGRNKDMQLCHYLVAEGLIEKQLVRERLDATRIEESEIVPVYRRLESLAS